MVCGLSAALSTMLTEAELEPVAVGVKVTLIVQLLPAETELPQVFVSAKSKVVVEMPVIFSVALPELVRVTDWAALVVPTI